MTLLFKDATFCVLCNYVFQFINFMPKVSHRLQDNHKMHSDEKTNEMALSAICSEIYQ